MNILADAGAAGPVEREVVMTHLTFAEAIIVGLIQGTTELFPVSSLGHNVLIPAIIGGSWAQDLNVSRAESPYLAFVVGLHVATAIGITVYFWRDWVRIIGGFFSSIARREVKTPDQKLAWMIVLATIPVGLVGLKFEHEFRVIFGVPTRAAIFLILNGIILFAGERFRTRKSRQADEQVLREREEESAPVGAGRIGGAHSSGQRALRQQEIATAVQADRRITSFSYLQAVVIGSAQILALLAGISRDGVTMVAGMFRGLSREDAARFAFLLATPVILAAGVLKIPDLLGPLGNGVRPQILAGSIVSGIAAYLSVRFLMKYFQTRTLTPFAIYCLVFGTASLVYLTVK
ncbi:MAG TPA: undecaprenyl-diphosphate phosphatase [Streptosporangiaceae bacterium]|nr:undecaprenyl-diphosphate phosphatase [Streptosporangiaceae bacterium]